jgi:catechol 2,3-dioxygenase-like lactoylglutathione lyase family enzyme
MAVRKASQREIVKFDHMALPVSDVVQSRDWYVKNLGFKVEFERGGISAIQDSAGFTIFLRKATSALIGDKITLTIQVNSVDRKHQELARAGLKFVNAPQRLSWGYGAELLDPNGYMVNLWDQATMRKAMRQDARKSN